jgi:hypothetical protein
MWDSFSFVDMLAFSIASGAGDLSGSSWLAPESR